MLFGTLSGLDPRSLGDAECSGFELGMSRAQIGALQRIAYEQLAVEGKIKVVDDHSAKNTEPARCERV